MKGGTRQTPALPPQISEARRRPKRTGHCGELRQAALGPRSLNSSHSLAGWFVYCPGPHGSTGAVEPVLRLVHRVARSPRPTAAPGSSQSASRCLLSTHCVPDILLGTQDTSVNKTGVVLTLLELPELPELPFQGE